MNNRPSDIPLPEGWDWDRVEAARVANNMNDNWVPVAQGPNVVAWGTIQGVRAIHAMNAYEADRQARPFYHDGTPRKAWIDLDKIARDSWIRNPTPRF